ncbi:DNA repair protein RecO [Rhodospirillum rubrum F11]|uniref:DNA repair protein RecO n=4 Tax=Rhodospirillum rubrum TaxID=1085 RepID=RECO_RHORT|nr:DNA repair protein RecO [Rhodospirillum rubrum]Q2RT96.1 RecName: Full=DNA repair protein RecO; AltName: Full=Recombination protein O [Rhodospirillum rubrum ATCC 11170]ABC22649.1 Recombination protein O, RecO [Rhodospirillum rubrum ATCC 11170]AEO48367.1 DNA repair protein RecO [Rhodospirillum rubrum F11]MBK5954246.1 DNA repair protein RecO [Rhodospirillum rubrum]QXG82271.1 DNA repair protein RecO [Rhodospirillum rubrum]
MIEWSDRGIVLAARPHGEDGVIVSLLSAGHGRHSGIVRGGRGKRLRAALQPGSLVQATWKARLEDHLGSLVVELLAGVAGGLLDDRDRLAALAAACALAETVLPERAPQADVYDATLALLDALAEGGEGTPLVWAGAFVRWEIGLLAALGFGLDLSCCAVSGECGDLAYVSPRSGRAVGREAGAPWQARLLALPAFLLSPAEVPANAQAVGDGLRLSGYFLEGHVLAPQGRGLPASRQRFVERLRRWSAADR